MISSLRFLLLLAILPKLRSDSKFIDVDSSKVIDTAQNKQCACKDGTDGKNGADGKTIFGPPGSDGRPGTDGKEGANGFPGPQGPKGTKGATGDIGPRGPEGLRGPDGDCDIASMKELEKNVAKLHKEYHLTRTQFDEQRQILQETFQKEMAELSSRIQKLPAS